MAESNSKNKKNKGSEKPQNPGKGSGGGTSAWGDVIRNSVDTQRLFVSAGSVGLLGLAASAVLGMGDFKRFQYSYLVAFMWVLSIGLGGVWWVTLQHLVNAKWSIVVRRIGELIAANAGLLAILSLPIVIPALLGNSDLYLWVDHNRMAEDHALHHKSAYLNVPFFAIRVAVYFAFWVLLSQHLLKSSLKQDEASSDTQSRRLRRLAGPAMMGVAVTLTFAAIDFLMSLNPLWFSTIFGIYYLAGCVLAIHASLALTLLWLQKRGTLVKTVSQEHFHDIGKMMFAFTIFWAYIAFSQFMLIWYANIPEETHWYLLRVENGWLSVTWFQLIGHFVMPFAFLLSRHVKRHRTGIALGALWVLFVHYVDMYWLVMPTTFVQGPELHLLDLSCWIGLTGVFIAAVAYRARKVNLVPVGDPRLETSLAFENV
ncbi:MAG: hypothetical protein SFV15_17890 [Polyangiaceae bacterium]|nr:hypothetical protein [Polyangiaceae bacterium]